MSNQEIPKTKRFLKTMILKKRKFGSRNGKMKTSTNTLEMDLVLDT